MTPAADPRRDVPRSLRLDLPSQRLLVTWHDGHASAYGAGWLRFVCPCAGCRGHGPGQVPPPEWEAVKDVKILDAAGVGGYAVQFTFSDGHATGIYSFDRLRTDCPCAECRKGWGGVGGEGPPPG